MPPDMSSREEGREDWKEGVHFPPLSAQRKRVVEVVFQKLLAKGAAMDAESAFAFGLVAKFPDLCTAPKDEVMKAALTALLEKGGANGRAVKALHTSPAFRPSLPVLRALGVHSRIPNVALARFHSVNYAYAKYMLEPGRRGMEAFVKAWMEDEAGREGGWEGWVLRLPIVACWKWARYLKARGGKWGRRRSVFPHGRGGEVEEEREEEEECIRLFP